VPRTLSNAFGRAPFCACDVKRRIVGILSTDFVKYHRPKEVQMRSIADAVLLAADAIIQIRANGDGHVDRAKNAIKSLLEWRDAIARADCLLSRGRQLYR
jgi:hypothetical protein